ncbi:MAG: HEAT repeat domain-containing protein [Myxococcota bacterium]
MKAGTSHFVPRFWASADSQPPVDGAGYLRADFERSRVRPLADFEAVPCLVLLGDAGMGKSSEITGEVARLETRFTPDALVRRVDLGSTSDDYGLRMAVFSDAGLDSPTRTLRDGPESGEPTLYLLLDGLDEARLEVAETIRVLSAEIERLDELARRRLRLRVSCRTSTWPAFSELGTALKKWWGEAEQFQILQLAPLRFEDMEALTRSELKDSSQDFITQLRAHNQALRLGSRPLWLESLHDVYADQGRLPNSLRELFERGCRAMCARRKGDPPAGLSADERLAVARRIAAVSVLTGRDVIVAVDQVRGLGWTEGASERLQLADFGIGLEPVLDLSGRTGGQVPVDEMALRETATRTQLFTGSLEQHPARVQFVHRSYSEFLAAWKLSSLTLPVARIYEYLSREVAGLTAIVPQFHGVAAWLAAFSRAFWHRIVATEPEILLSGDVLAADSEMKARLVEALLSRVRTIALLPAELGRLAGLPGIAFEGLDEVLRTTIANREEPPLVREAALEIAEACPMPSLDGLLAERATDPGEPDRVRLCATLALGELRTPTAIAALRQLALGRAGNDPDDELRGAALHALWPDQLGDSELFEALMPHQRSNLFGQYKSFIMFALEPRLNAQRLELAPALAWVEDHANSREDVRYEWQKLESLILEAAWGRLGEPGVLAALARAALAWSQRYRSVRRRLERALDVEHDAARRALVAEIVSLISSGAEGRPEHVAHFHDWIVSRDADWLAERVRTSETARERSAWEWLAKCAASRSVLSPSSAPRLREVLAPVAHMRAVLATDPDGHRSAWPTLVAAGEWNGSPLTESAWWEAADQATRAEVLEVARRFVVDPPDAGSDWVGTASTPWSELLGLAALCLLSSADPDAAERVPTSALGRWLGILLSEASQLSAAAEHQQWWLQRAAAADRDAVSRVIDAAFRPPVDGAAKSHPTLLRHLESVWSAAVEDRLAALLPTENLHAADFGQVLRMLLAQNHSEARRLALETVGDASADMARRVAAGFAWLGQTPSDPAAWSTTWEAIQTDKAFGHALVHELVHGLSESFLGTLRASLPARALADLYIWVRDHAAPSEEPADSSASWSELRAADIEDWQFWVRRELASRGTPEGFQALKRVLEREPSSAARLVEERDARRYLLKRSRLPARPAKVVEWLETGRSGEIHDADDLMRRVVYALEDYQAALDGDGPDRGILERIYRAAQPGVVETNCSEIVCRELMVRLSDLSGLKVVVEPQLSLKLGSAKGKRADLEVIATTSSGEAVHIVFECKLATSKAVDSALEAQLVDRYLVDPKNTHGVYLVYFLGERDAEKADELRATMDSKAALASKRSRRKVRAFVLDASA